MKNQYNAIKQLGESSLASLKEAGYEVRKIKE